MGFKKSREEIDKSNLEIWRLRVREESQASREAITAAKIQRKLEIEKKRSDRALERNRKNEEKAKREIEKEQILAAREREERFKSVRVRLKIDLNADWSVF